VAIATMTSLSHCSIVIIDSEFACLHIPFQRVMWCTTAVVLHGRCWVGVSKLFISSESK